MGLVLVFLMVLSAAEAGLTSEDIAKIQATPIGERVFLSVPAGDGCNTCTAVYVRINETQIQSPYPYGDEVLSCTAMACGIKPGPVIEFAPSRKPQEPLEEGAPR